MSIFRLEDRPTAEIRKPDHFFSTDVNFDIGTAEKKESAALVFHMKPGSSAYLENVNIGAEPVHTATAARGMLIESKGPTWLWAISSNNNELYQYSFSRAEDVVAGPLSASKASSTITSHAHHLTDVAPFNGDPDIDSAMAAIRISNSKDITILSAGDLISSSSTLFDMKGSQRIDIINANSAISNKNSPIIPDLKEPSTAKRQERFDVASVASLANFAEVPKNYIPYVLWEQEDVDELSATPQCKAVLMAEINCFNFTLGWRNRPTYHGSLFSTTMTEVVCNPKCKESIKLYIDRVAKICKDWKFDSGVSPPLAPSYIYYGLNETCATDSKGNNCNGK